MIFVLAEYTRNTRENERVGGEQSCFRGVGKMALLLIEEEEETGEDGRVVQSNKAFL